MRRLNYCDFREKLIKTFGSLGTESWARANATFLMITLLSLYTVLDLYGVSENAPIEFIIAYWSTQKLYPLALLLMLPMFNKFYLALSIYATVAICFLWQVASLFLFKIQCRFFFFDELVYLISSKNTRPLVYENLLSSRVFLFIICFSAIYYLLYRILRDHFSNDIHKGLMIGFFSLFIIGIVAIMVKSERSRYFVNKKSSFYLKERLCCMPWNWAHDEFRKAPVVKDFNILRKHWYTPSCFWLKKPNELIKEIGNSVRERSVVVVILESHAYLCLLKNKSEDYPFNSPYLANLAKNNVSFSNYIQSGMHTFSAVWSMLTGGIYFRESDFSPQLTQLGPLANFQAAGYTTEWLQATNIHYAGFNELAKNGSLFAKFKDGEISDDMIRDIWTAWGMPDEEIFSIAFNRISKKTLNREKYLQFILTISNHDPFRIPKEFNGVKLDEGRKGAIRYADLCLKNFMIKIKSLPCEKQPVVFITADTSYRAGKTFDVEPLESMRIPGVLVLPEDAPLKYKDNGMMSHQDLLPLLAELVGVDTPFKNRVLNYKRIAAPIYNWDGHSIITDQWYSHSSGKCFSLTTPWNFQKDNMKLPAQPHQLFLTEYQKKTWITSEDTAHRCNSRVMLNNSTDLQ